MDYKKLFYRKLELPLDEAIELIPDNTEYIDVWNGEFLTYFGFIKDVEIGIEVDYDNDKVISTHIDWWSLHPETFPHWQTKEGE